MGCESCGAVKSASERIKKDKRKHEIHLLLIVLLFVMVCAAMICGTVISCHTISEQQATIREQQWVIASQYDQLASLLSGAEIVTEEYTNEAQTDDGGTAIAGSGNTYVGGDLIGNGEK